MSHDQRRAQVERVLDRFEARVALVLPGLRAQVIHGDNDRRLRALVAELAAVNQAIADADPRTPAAPPYSRRHPTAGHITPWPQSAEPVASAAISQRHSTPGPNVKTWRTSLQVTGSPCVSASFAPPGYQP
jgi:hypothetical protein